MQHATVNGNSPATVSRPCAWPIADDSYLLREAIGQVLETRAAASSVVAVCSDGDELLAAVEDHRPDVVVVDIRMPPSGDDEGIAIANRLRETHPDIGVVVLSQYVDPRYGLALLEQRLRRARVPAQGAPARPRAPDRRGRGGRALAARWSTRRSSRR